jgi:hypothetical protein
MAGQIHTSCRNFIFTGRVRKPWIIAGFMVLHLVHLKDGCQLGESRMCSSHIGSDGVSIYFICKDALAIYREVMARGIKATRPFVGNSMWVTSMTDPDGYKISFESYTDAAEETVYSES